MNTLENKQTMARNIKFYMAVKGVTNQQLCADLDIKYTTFVEWIKGRAYPRIGAVEKLANYFECEKSDLIEDRSKKPTGEDDGFSEKKRELIRFASTVPEEKADFYLRVMRTISEDD